MSRQRRISESDKPYQVVSHAVLTLWSIIVIAPLAWTLLSSFKTTREIFASPFS